ncbi:MAG: hypothetical protein PVG35_09655 [Desulfobacterales bacterium]|jgi:asparagine synthetase A
MISFTFKETLKVRLKMSGQQDFLSLPSHRAVLNDEIPLSIGGGKNIHVLEKLNRTLALKKSRFS